MLAKISGFMDFADCASSAPIFTDAAGVYGITFCGDVLFNGARDPARAFAHFANNADVEHCFCDEIIRCKCIMHDMMMPASQHAYAGREAALEKYHREIWLIS